MGTYKNFLTAIFAFLLSATAHSAIRPFYQDVKLPNQRVLEYQLVTDPAAAGTTNILSAHAGATSTAAVTVSTFVAQPDVPRNLVITPGVVNADVGACTITVNGTNYVGQTISETFAFLADATAATTGAKAFKTVTSVVFPLNCETTPFGATWNIGWGEKIGLKRCMDAAGHYAFSTVAGVYETTRGTIVADADEVEKNTIDFNGTMDGSADFEVFFIQNFAQACQP